MIKRWLDPVTVNKISILGSNYQSALLAQVPGENLPVQFGGTCRCPGGCELSDAGPWQDPQWLDPKDRPAPAGGSKEPAKVSETISGKTEDATESIMPDANTETAGAPDETTVHVA